MCSMCAHWCFEFYSCGPCCFLLVFWFIWMIYCFSFLIYMNGLCWIFFFFLNCCILSSTYIYIFWIVAICVFFVSFYSLFDWLFEFLLFWIFSSMRFEFYGSTFFIDFMNGAYFLLLCSMFYMLCSVFYMLSLHFLYRFGQCKADRLVENEHIWYIWQVDLVDWIRKYIWYILNHLKIW